MVSLPSISDQTSLVFIGGATASGKSDLALCLAEKHNGIIINADALQIYSDLSIITARPSIQDMVKIPHFLYGFLSIEHTYNVMDWCRSVKTIIEEHADRKIFIVGGTGLYFKSLLYGIAPIPDIPDAIRTQARSMNNQELYDALLKIDLQATQKLHINDTHRLARAYEVRVHTGESLYDLQKKSVSFIPSYLKTEKYLLNPTRDIVYQRINKRFDSMIEQGVLAEVAKIMHYKKPNQAIKAVGVPELMAYIENETSLEYAIDKAKQSSRNYAKRQLTFFNNQFSDFIKI